MGLLIWCLVYCGAVLTLVSANLFMDAPPPMSHPHLSEDDREFTAISTSFVGDHAIPGSLTDAETNLDTSFYSRQLYVYGKAAQVKLAKARIAVLGDGGLAQEVIKNLVLGGVGYITVVVNGALTGTSSDRSQQASILGESPDLVHYVKALNPHVHVDLVEYHNETFPTHAILERNISHVVVCGEDFHHLLEINRFSRQHFLRMTAGNVQGVSGYVFNDFLFAFDIEDVEGESYKEIPLKFQSKLLAEEHMVEVSAIDEERFGFGLDDVVEIRSAKNSDHVYHGIVKEVKSISTCTIQIVDERFDMQGFLEGLQTLIHAGDAIVLKMKSQQTIAHQPLLFQLLKPSFIPVNGCLSKKQDQALNLALFAAIKVRDLFSRRSTAKKISDKVFLELMMRELRLLGVIDPLLPIKQGGKVGKEWLDYVCARFYQSCAGGQCPAVTSVLGSVMAQEVVKGITQMYTPISQWYLFESLDSLHLDSSESRTVEDVQQRSVEYSMHEGEMATQRGRAGCRVDMYDSEVLDEVKRMKIFMVGSGAIGCELLKTFALLGIGANDVSAEDVSVGLEDEDVLDGNELDNGDDAEETTPAPANLWKEHGMRNGGILVTDMDMIERSNLNRQLLFRERHIGQAKSAVVAEQILHINPAMKVHGLQLKMSTDTEGVFDEDFWKSCDLVVTALDNVEARKYVDSKCVENKVFLVDSGTLGTKANVQVVLPYLTESYSSSSDPPEDSIPLCTLKSFPYQPDHCVAWAKSVFEQTFADGVVALSQFLTLLTSTEGDSNKAIDDYLDTLSNEDVARLSQQVPYLRQLAALEDTTASEGSSLLRLSTLLSWSWDGLSRYFHSDIATLLREHPLDEVDEENQPFWGGSRRMPTALQLQDVLRGASAKGFLQYHVMLLSHTLFARHRDTDMSCIEQAVDEFVRNNATAFVHPREISLEDAKNVLKAWAVEVNQREPLRHFVKRSLQLEPASFEKDDLTLGHVQFVTVAANLRSHNYGLQALDQLQVQKIAGNIVPAVATTTSLVAGLVALEVMKIASERVLARRQQLFTKNGISSAEESHSIVDDVLADSELSKRKEQAKSYVQGLFRKLSSFRRSSHPSDVMMEEDITEDREQVIDFQLWKQDKDRIFKRFRNSFINIATPLLAFTQPVESESYSIADRSFNQWDDIIMEGDITDITLQELLLFLEEQYQVSPTSVSCDDVMLYASYLSPSDEMLAATLWSVLQTQLGDTAAKELIHGKKYLHLLVTGDVVQSEGEEDEEARDVTLPPVKITIPSSLFSAPIISTSNPFESELDAFDVEQEMEAAVDAAATLQSLVDEASRGRLSAEDMKDVLDQITATLGDEEGDVEVEVDFVGDDEDTVFSSITRVVTGEPKPHDDDELSAEGDELEGKED